MALGNLPVPGPPTIWIFLGQGPTAIAVGAGGGCLNIFTLIYPFSPLSPSLWETAQYRLKYCLIHCLVVEKKSLPNGEPERKTVFFMGIFFLQNTLFLLFCHLYDTKNTSTDMLISEGCIGLIMICIATIFTSLLIGLWERQRSQNSAHRRRPTYNFGWLALLGGMYIVSVVHCIFIIY